MIPAASWSAAALAASVPSATVSAADDIRDIRPPIPIPSLWLAIAIGAAVLAVAVVAFAAYRRWRRRASRSLTPEARALRALDAADALAARGRAREWAELVATTLRDAVAARLETAISAATTRELADGPWLRDARVAPAGGERLVELLAACDAARFAKGRFEAGALAASTLAAREWVAALFAVPAPTEHDAPPTQRSAAPSALATTPRPPSPASPSEVAR